jgi:peroxiredoxin
MMSQLTRTWLRTLIALAGVGLTVVWGPLGVAVSFVGSTATALGAVRLNVPLTRAAYYVAALLNAIAIFVASGNLALAASGICFVLFTMSNDILLRHARWLLDVQAAAGVIAGTALLALAWPTGWWVLAIVPNALVGIQLATKDLALAKSTSAQWSDVAVSVGSTMPDVELPYRDHDGQFTLSSQRGKFVLLAFVRGDWCPVCHVMIRILGKEARMLAEHDVQVVLITPSDGEIDREMTDRLGLQPGMLLDRDSRLARTLGLIEEKSHQGKDVPMPVSILIGPRGTVRHVSGPDDMTTFTSGKHLADVLTREPHAVRPLVAA